ncbi:MAG: hypothetical protein CTY18_05740 [Methylomonas sp.]|nr:MAG: hypothetical protein CTY24_12495 [Methylobacter sp.]PPD35978.1 MAG: hypothetical protein CTY18_05740 [Methylomonas sp.]
MPLFRPNIIDFEASGFGFDSYPIEVGVVLNDGRKYCALIKPAEDWQYWDPNAESIHGLSLEVLWSYGKPINLVARELNVFLENKTVYSDGWVVDKPWLSRLFCQSGLTPSFFLSSLEYILKEPQMEIWTQTQHQIMSELALTRHRASSDALVIQETYVRTQQLALAMNA